MESQMPQEEQPKKISQKNCTFIALCRARNFDHSDVVSLEKSSITKEQRKKARAIIKQMILDGQVACKPKYDDKALNKYCSGLISNWLGKDSRYVSVKETTDEESV